MTIQIDGECGRPHEIWHLRDGGVVENTGVETLREAIFARDNPSPATIQALDAKTDVDIPCFSVALKSR
jgi:hypothetical protein